VLRWEITAKQAPAGLSELLVEVISTMFFLQKNQLMIFSFSRLKGY